MSTTLTVTATIEGGLLTVTVTGFAPFTIDPARMPSALNDYAALHGYKQRLVDAAALGADATPAQRHAAIQTVVTHMAETGEWSRRGCGEGNPGDGLLVRAVAEFAGLTLDAAREQVKALDKKHQAAMRASAELRPIIDRIRAERPAAKPAKGVDVAGILAGIRASAEPVTA